MHVGLFPRRGLLAALLALSFGPVAAHAQFKGTIEQAIEEMGDFSADNKTFEVISAKPLHIRLSPRIMTANAPDQANEEVLRAAVYGVYRTFIHTDQAQVQVTAQPLLLGANGQGAKLLSVPRATVTVTRDKALQVAKKTLGVKAFKELVDSDDTWSDKMQNGRYVGRKPGLQQLAQELGVSLTAK